MIKNKEVRCGKCRGERVILRNAGLKNEYYDCCPACNPAIYKSREEADRDLGIRRFKPYSVRK